MCTKMQILWTSLVLGSLLLVASSSSSSGTVSSGPGTTAQTTIVPTTAVTNKPLTLTPTITIASQTPTSRIVSTGSSTSDIIQTSSQLASTSTLSHSTTDPSISPSAPSTENKALSITATTSTSSANNEGTTMPMTTSSTTTGHVTDSSSTTVQENPGILPTVAGVQSSSTTPQKTTSFIATVPGTQSTVTTVLETHNSLNNTNIYPPIHHKTSTNIPHKISATVTQQSSTGQTTAHHSSATTASTTRQTTSRHSSATTASTTRQTTARHSSATTVLTPKKINRFVSPNSTGDTFEILCAQFMNLTSVTINCNISGLEINGVNKFSRIELIAVQPSEETTNSEERDTMSKESESEDTPMTSIAIAASCGALAFILFVFAVYFKCHRSSYRKNQQHLTEELQTVENGYHDNPTLEVMEVQPEMQEKKLALNGEFNDNWIVPFDNLAKDDIPDEEDTHL